MEFRHLRYFVCVATERSFSRASELLHIAQPPLSRQIQQLEEEVGTQLLHRGRPITLTEPGRYFFEQARMILQRIDEMRAMTQRIGKGARKRASRPGGTTVIPPGFLRSEAILHTTFAVETPSEHVRDVEPRTATWMASAIRRAPEKNSSTLPRSR